MQVVLSAEDRADALATIKRFAEKQAQLKAVVLPPVIDVKKTVLRTQPKPCEPRAETPHRAAMRLRAWEIARGWSQQELAGMLSRLIWRLDSRRLRPSEARRVEGVAALVASALTLAESLDQADAEFKRQAINEVDRVKVGEQFAQFFDELVATDYHESNQPADKNSGITEEITDMSTENRDLGQNNFHAVSETEVHS